MRQDVSYAGDVDFGPDSVLGNAGYNALRLRWFDRWLLDIPNGVEDDPPVRIFVMGGAAAARRSRGSWIMAASGGSSGNGHSRAPAT